MKLTKKEHIERHRKLHKNLDELFADFTTQTDKGLTATIEELIKWSYEQTKNPDDEKN